MSNAIGSVKIVPKPKAWPTCVAFSEFQRQTQHWVATGKKGERPIIFKHDVVEGGLQSKLVAFFHQRQ